MDTAKLIIAKAFMEVNPGYRAGAGEPGSFIARVHGRVLEWAKEWGEDTETVAELFNIASKEGPQAFMAYTDRVPALYRMLSGTVTEQSKGIPMEQLVADRQAAIDKALEDGLRAEAAARGQTPTDAEIQAIMDGGDAGADQSAPADDIHAQVQASAKTGEPVEGLTDAERYPAPNPQRGPHTEPGPMAKPQGEPEPNRKQRRARDKMAAAQS